MIFKGDLSKYHPADAMTFLSQVGSDGVLSIAGQHGIIALTFKAGRLLDVQSASGDQKLLRFLRHDGRINDSQVRQIQQIQRETGLSVRQILGKLDFFSLKDIQALLSMSMFEVLLHLFLLDQGGFNFTEAPVEDDGAGIQMDIGKIVLKVLTASDEYRDYLKTIQTADRTIQVRSGVDLSEKTELSQGLVLRLAAKYQTVQELLEKAPLPSHEVLQYIQSLMDQGALSMGPPRKSSASQDYPVADPTFSAYKQALKALLSNPDVLNKLGAIVSFCKSYYENMLILTAKQGVFVQCKILSVGADHGLFQKTAKGNLGRIEDDPVFSTVYRSGAAFFGKSFPSRLLDRFVEPLPNNECALIPIMTSPTISIFFYASTSKRYSGISCHHYLELLSWVIDPSHNHTVSVLPDKGSDASPDAPQREPKHSWAQGSQADDTQKGIVKMVGRIKDLPPLPNIVTSAMQLLSDPETPTEEIEAVIGQDQALVTKLIKVGNSALYGGLQKVTSLRQVLTRLGLKTTRNLILSASAHSYFINNQKGMRTWVQNLWQHSVETGLAARRIAEITNYTDPEEAFIGGLVHDIGKLIILMLFPKPFKEILKIKKVDQLDSKTAEYRIIGLDHEQIGRILMDRWNMPDSAKTCAEYHHRYQESQGYPELSAIVAYADYLSRQYGTKPEALLDEDHIYAQNAATTLKLSESSKATIAEAVIDDFQHAELMMG